MDEPAAPSPPASLADGLPEQSEELQRNAPQSRFDLRGRSLRQFAARGTLINTAFMIGLSLLGFARGFILAIFLSREDYGVWGVLAVSLGTLLWLKQLGVGDKFIQQDEPDQEKAFQKAFTFELATNAIFIGILAAALPIVCIIYGEWELFAPGMFIVLLILPSGTLRAPLWIFYRRMEFLKQRALQAIDPVVAFVVSIGMAIAGFGYWALVGGMFAGAWCAAIGAVAFSPYKLRLRWDKGTLKEYWSFSWPLFVQGGSSMVIAQSAVFATEAHLGLAGAGAVALASTITQLTHRVDSLVTGTLYPAICAVQDRLDLLYESFVKTNRLALMWAVPFGFGLALFCGDLVTYVIGEKWRPAVELLQIYGIVAGIGHIGFNWDAYFRARADTKPMATASVAAMITFVATLPLLFIYDLRGLAMGVALQAAAHVAVRAYYLRRLFDGFAYLGHASRAILPTVPALGLVLGMRLMESDDRTFAMVAAEIAVYSAVTIVATWWLEKSLLREMLGYLRVRRAASAAA